jgi:hypothetical protein
MLATAISTRSPRHLVSPYCGELALAVAVMQGDKFHQTRSEFRVTLPLDDSVVNPTAEPLQVIPRTRLRAR